MGSTKRNKNRARRARRKRRNRLNSDNSRAAQIIRNPQYVKKMYGNIVQPEEESVDK